VPLVRPFAQQLAFFREQVLQVVRVYGLVPFSLEDLVTDTESDYIQSPAFVRQGDIKAVVHHFVELGWLKATYSGSSFNFADVTVEDCELELTDLFPIEGENLQLSLPASLALTSPDLQADAALAASLYTELFILENTIRACIEDSLRVQHGDKWIAKGLPADIVAHIGRVARHDDRDWRSGPEEPDLKFADFGELARAIDDDDQLFRSPNTRMAVVADLMRLEPDRDDVAHMRLMPPKERQRFLAAVRDLQNRFDNVRARQREKGPKPTR
jgi:hypothetical protein